MAGRIPAGKYTVLACKRQLADLKRKRFAYTFDDEEAERVALILQAMPLVKGEWAARKELLKLSDWQAFFVTTVFGWRNKKTRKRRFREVLLCVARKNGKSALAAAIALYMLGLDGEHGPEIYCGATTEKQAMEVFKPAKLMANKFEEWRDLTGYEVRAKTISRVYDGGKMEALIGDPGDGSSPSLAIVDEYHEHKKPNLYNTMLTGMGARSQPIQLTITTAGDDVGSPCHRLQRTMESILDGSAMKKASNEEKFALIFHADEEDVDENWTDPSVLPKANPNMGISVSREFLISQQQNAQVDPAQQNSFKNKHLNIWTSARNSYYNMLKWTRCRNSQLRIADFEGRDCYMAVDLSSKQDLTAVLLVFPEWRDQVHYYLFPTFYLPAETILRDETGRYAAWLNTQQLRQTEGAEIDMQVIRRDILAAHERFNVLEAAFDPWRGTELMRGLDDEGANVIEYRGTTGKMSEPMKETKAAIDSRRVHHPDNEVLTWCLSNVVAREDANSNVFPRKKDDDPKMKIDGAITFIMAAGRIMYQEAEDDLNDWLGVEHA